MGSPLRQRWLHVFGVILPLFFQFLTVAITRAVLPMMLDKQYGDTAYQYNGYAEGAKGFLSFLSAPAIGTISDTAGRRWVLLVSVAGTLAPIVLLAITDELSVYLIATALSGLFAGSIPLVLAMVADLTANASPAQKSAAFGFSQAAAGLSFSIGPLLGSKIADQWSERSPFWVASVIALMNVLYVAFVLPETLPHQSEVQQEQRTLCSTLDPMQNVVAVIGESRRLQKLTIVVAMHAMGVACKIATLSLYMKIQFDSSQDQIGDFLSTMGICFLISEAIVMPLMAPQIGEWALVTIGLLAFIAQMVQLACARTTLALYLAMFWPIFYGVVYPACGSLASKVAGSNSQGKVQGAVQSVRLLMEGVAPFLFGPMMNVFSGTAVPGAAYFICAVGLAIGFTVAFSEMWFDSDGKNSETHPLLTPKTHPLHTRISGSSLSKSDSEL